MKVCVDTNVLMNSQFNFDDYEKVKISIILVEELDKLKNHETKGYQARQAIKKIEKANNKEIIFWGTYSGVNFLEHNNDNEILRQAYEQYVCDNEFIFLTDDLCLKVKADALGLPCERYKFKDNNQELYKGYKEITLTDYEQAVHYECPVNKWGLLINEYLVIKNENGEIIDKQRWTEKGFVSIGYKQIDNINLGKIKPRNPQQELAFDLFQNKNIAIKAVFGKYGSGKDYIMSAHAISQVQRGVYDKILFVRNNYSVKNSKEIGFLPGTEVEKLTPFAMPLADHLGGIDGLKFYISQGKIELQHLGFIRGRDIKNTIIYVTEAENMTAEHIQLLIGRLAEGSSLWLNGDFKQVDDGLFERNSGLKTMINSLKGNNLFGCVELNTTERSKVAQLADLMD